MMIRNRTSDPGIGLSCHYTGIPGSNMSGMNKIKKNQNGCIQKVWG